MTLVWCVQMSQWSVSVVTQLAEATRHCFEEEEGGAVLGVKLDGYAVKT